MNAKLSIETISPKQAQLYLDNIFDGQRKIRPHYVEKIAHDIREGRFRLSPDCLVLVKGKLANGQHRLTAVVLSGIQCQFIVLRTDDEELYRVIDCGAKRTEADCFVTTDNAKSVSSIARLVLEYDKGAITPLGSDRNVIVTRSDIIEYITAHLNDLEEQAAVCLKLYSSRPIVPVSLSGALLHIASRKTPKKATEFIESVYNGNSHDDSAFDVRERIIRNQQSKAKLPRSYIFGLLIKAFKSYANGTRPGALRLTEGELFPII